VSQWIVEARLPIETYIRAHPGFLESYTPVPDNPLAPPIIREMTAASKAAGVGPMAAVAGAIAEYVGQRCRQHTPGEVIVENGGDLFVWVEQPLVMAIWAGASPLSGRVGITHTPRGVPVGICTSSGTVGHSKSFGLADAVTVLSSSAALADAAATAAGNLVKTGNDIESALKALSGIHGVLGAVIIKGARLGAWGEIELVPMKDSPGV
jgi:ApbE superfamily uncharacterized protein (UPF0280 family)